MAANARASSSSSEVEGSGPLDAVIALGKALTDQLWPEGHADRLGLWMAHHVAELMETARTARGRTKVDAEGRCRRAVLELWAYRREVEGRRPTEKLEPLIDTLALLNPEEPDPYYYRQIWRARRETEVEEESSVVREWLEVARAIDVAARNLIGWSLSRAAFEAVDQVEPWVELAKKAAAPDDLLVTLTLRLQSMLPDLAHGGSHLAAPVRERLEQFNRFREAATMIETELRRALELAERNDEGAKDDEEGGVDL